jgi:phosphate transport system protein
MPEARHQFREALKDLERQMLESLDLVIGQLDRALESVSDQEVELAGIVIADGERIDRRYLEIHEELVSLLALQAPVAGDLRIVAALLHIMRCVERMGDQCVNIAKLVQLSEHEAPKDREILDRIERMGQLARSEVLAAKEVFATRSVALSQDLVRLGGEIDQMSRAIINRRGRRRRRSRAPRVGDVHDPRCALPRAHRREHRRHRRTDGVRRDRTLPRVHRRTATGRDRNGLRSPARGHRRDSPLGRDRDPSFLAEHRVLFATAIGWSPASATRNEPAASTTSSPGSAAPITRR